MVGRLAIIHAACVCVCVRVRERETYHCRDAHILSRTASCIGGRGEAGARGWRRRSRLGGG